MKTTILYRPNSEHARSVDNFARDFKRAYSEFALDLVDVDSREGTQLIQLYDITDYPAIIVQRENDGSVSMIWQGAQLPMLDEVGGYLLQ